MKRSFIFTLALAGCAATYEPPTSLSPSVIDRISRPKIEIFYAAQRALAASGYQITYANESSGTISTAPRDLRMRPENADCGTTWGIDYLLDNRTSTRVSYSVIVYDGRIEIRSTVQGEYKPGESTQDITLTCVSRGQLEAEMLRKIQSELL